MKSLLLLVLYLGAQSKAQYQYNLRSYEVEDLNVEPSYRAVKLTWGYPRGPEPSGFTVRVCEQTPWRLKQPCRQRHLSFDGSKQKTNIHDVLKRLSRRRYEADLYQLRMLTNYTLSVEPSAPLRTLVYTNTDFTRSKQAGPKNIEVTTKGFTARASRCLGNTTDVEVQTGPFFSGKISVEDVQDERCAIYGDQRSPKEIYTLTISHKICGSKKVNNSRIETPVLVHENRELVTHNSRRFLVVCNFVSDSFTVKASVEVPNIKSSSKDIDAIDPIGHSVIEADPNEIFDAKRVKDRHNNFRDSRFLAEQAAVVQKKALKPKATADSTQLIATIFLSTVFTIVFVGAMLWLVKTSRSMLSMSRRHAAPSPSSVDVASTANNALPSAPSKATEDEQNLVQNCSLELERTENDYENVIAGDENEAVVHDPGHGDANPPSN